MAFRQSRRQGWALRQAGTVLAVLALLSNGLLPGFHLHCLISDHTSADLGPPPGHHEHHDVAADGAQTHHDHGRPGHAHAGRHADHCPPCLSLLVAGHPVPADGIALPAPESDAGEPLGQAREAHIRLDAPGGLGARAPPSRA